MKKQLNIILTCLLLPLITFGNTTNTIVTAMMAEFEACFAKKCSSKTMLNEWQWGYIACSYLFNIYPVDGKHVHTCYNFSIYPPMQASTNRIEMVHDFPKIGFPRRDAMPYLSLGVEYNRTEQKHSLIYVYCGSDSPLYPYILQHLKIQDPTYMDVKVKFPSTYWETQIYDKKKFEATPSEDQFVRLQEIWPGVDLFCRFARDKYVGVMLLCGKTAIQTTSKTVDAIDRGIIDLRALTNEFRWIPEHQVMEAEKMIASFSKQDVKERVRLQFEERVNLYKSNTKYAANLGFNFLGRVESPVNGYFTSLGQEYGYYKMACSGIVLKSYMQSGLWETVVSFVIEIDNLPKDVKIILPYNIDIELYRTKQPTQGVLYEHIRCDGQAKIIVQPYVAWLYENGILIRVLVCDKENGPEDRGWSLVRKFYCYEDMAHYYWPVYQEAYNPFGDATKK